MNFPKLHVILDADFSFGTLAGLVSNRARPAHNKVAQVAPRYFETRERHVGPKTFNIPAVDKLESLELNIVASGCSNDCCHCGEKSIRQSGLHVSHTKDIEFIVSRFAELKAAGKVAGMGINLLEEPFRRGDLLSLAGTISRIDPEAFSTISTADGSLIRREDNVQLLERMKEFGLRTIQVSFQGFGERHDDRVKNKGNYSHLIETARLAVSCGLKLVPTVFLYKDNLTEWQNTMLDLKRVKDDLPEQVRFAIAVHHGNCRAIEHLRLEEGDLSELPDDIVEPLTSSNRTERQWHEEFKDTDVILAKDVNRKSVWVLSGFSIYDGPPLSEYKLGALDTAQPLFALVSRHSNAKQRILEIVNGQDFVPEVADPGCTKLHDKRSIIELWLTRYCQRHGIDLELR